MFDFFSSLFSKPFEPAPEHPPSLEQLWKNTYIAQDIQNARARELIIDPDHHQVIDLGELVVHICGPKALDELSPCGTCIAGDQYQGRGRSIPIVNSIDHIWVLGGPLPNGNYYLDWGGFGHEFLHFEGHDADTMCEGV